MKRPSRMPSNLSESLHHRLNSYALAASAAGVSLAALAQPAEGRIIYTPTHKVIRPNELYTLSFSKGRTDFEIKNGRNNQGNYTYFTFLDIYGEGQGANYNQVSCNSLTIFTNAGVASALKKGSVIFGEARWLFRAAVLAAEYGGPSYGNWRNVKNRYLGLTFYVDKKKHYGWARMSVKTISHEEGILITGILTGYAYETIPNKPIIAGKTRGPDVITIQDASLGHLTRGASAIPAWRGSNSAK